MLARSRRPTTLPLENPGFVAGRSARRLLPPASQRRSRSDRTVAVTNALMECGAAYGRLPERACRNPRSTREIRVGGTDPALFTRASAEGARGRKETAMRIMSRFLLAGAAMFAIAAGTVRAQEPDPATGAPQSTATAPAATPTPGAVAPTVVPSEAESSAATAERAAPPVVENEAPTVSSEVEPPAAEPAPVVEPPSVPAPAVAPEKPVRQPAVKVSPEEAARGRARGRGESDREKALDSAAAAATRSGRSASPGRRCCGPDGTGRGRRPDGSAPFRFRRDHVRPHGVDRRNGNDRDGSKRRNMDRARGPRPGHRVRGRIDHPSAASRGSLDLRTFGDGGPGAAAADPAPLLVPSRSPRSREAVPSRLASSGSRTTSGVQRSTSALR